ncbi:MAG: polysaccharide deacetylase family protein [Flavobacteriaceae bacterium]|nr:polysaccharide deacetylase family protein [Flavobacteriaceae bacterium]
MWYSVKTPWLIPLLFPKFLWRYHEENRQIYLTFDDGPHPVITPWVLNELAKFDVKATFFCVGDNIKKYPGVFEQILAAGHSVGNHTFNHLNNWQTGTAAYLENIETAERMMTAQGGSKLFRPPHGKIKPETARKLFNNGYRIVMWDVLSGDFDKNISSEKCLSNICNNSRSGSIVVLHDSEKAWSHLEYVLPKSLEFFKSKGYRFNAIT